MPINSQREINAPASTPASMAAKPSNSRPASLASAFEALLTRGSVSSETTAAATMMPAMTRYTAPQLPHCSAQISAMPPDRIIAMR
jgi:hypothetical protein